MTFKYDKVYINETSTITGPYEQKGPLGKGFDKSYDDLYFGEKTWEQAEVKLIVDSIDLLLNKIRQKKDNIDLHISGDLLNQIVASNYAAAKIKIPLLGIYSACAISTQSIIMAANMLEAKQIKNCICSASSHNNAAEKQFRYPVEYGAPKPKTATFTATGCASAYLSNEKKGIKVESGTIGVVADMGITDPLHMGAVMAPSAGDTIYQHLQDTKRDVSYYDLILTGDLGKYGKKILVDYMKTKYGIELKNYNDTAVMLYDLKKQPVYAGGSGAVCAPLVTYSHIFKLMKRKELKRVLLVATGALLSTTMAYQKLGIPSISHAVSLEVA